MSIYPVGIEVIGKTTVIHWNDKSKTEATPSGRDKFDLEMGTLWALSKKFISTSKIVQAVYTATFFLDMDELDMLWCVAKKFMDESDIWKVIQAVDR